MDDLNVIDRFLAAFIQYIDSGFGLLGGDVAFLTSVLVGIDITLAGLFWAMGGEDDIIGRFLKKILYVGAFALIIGNFQPPLRHHLPLLFRAWDHRRRRDDERRRSAAARATLPGPGSRRPGRCSTRRARCSASPPSSTIS